MCILAHMHVRYQRSRSSVMDMQCIQGTSAAMKVFLINHRRGLRIGNILILWLLYYSLQATIIIMNTPPSIWLHHLDTSIIRAKQCHSIDYIASTRDRKRITWAHNVWISKLVHSVLWKFERCLHLRLGQLSPSRRKRKQGPKYDRFCWWACYLWLPCRSFEYSDFHCLVLSSVLSLVICRKLCGTTVEWRSVLLTFRLQEIQEKGLAFALSLLFWRPTTYFAG